MTTRASVCIGVNRAGNLTPLQAAVQGAYDFEGWASSQGFATKLLIDDGGKKVVLADIFDAVNEFVQAGIYEQLIIYFSGHGILTAPGTEYWLLSGAPQNPNEAVNLLKSVEDARNSGVPHVIFVSDACRSAVQGPPLSGVIGGIIFPNKAFGPQSGEIDVFYATRPGDPAWEVPEEKATQRYRGIFTDSLLKALQVPDNALKEMMYTGSTPLPVLTSRRLKSYLEAQVPIDAGLVDIQLRQIPQVRVETALPKYFALAPRTPAKQTDKMTDVPIPAPPSLFRKSGPASPKLNNLSQEKFYFSQEVLKLINAGEHPHHQMQTGFTVVGTEVRRVMTYGWEFELNKKEVLNSGASHIRLTCIDENYRSAASLLLEFSNGTGTLLAILPGFIGVVVVEKERVISVNYAPSRSSWRYDDYQSHAKELEEMKAVAAVASRQGKFVMDAKNAEGFADKIRQSKGLDPTMGLYAAYSYAQVGKHNDVSSVFRYMKEDYTIPVPFDVVLLASMYTNIDFHEYNFHFAPFAPMLTQGWSLFLTDHPLFGQIHHQLRYHLLPSLWTTYTSDGMEILNNHILSSRKI